MSLILGLIAVIIFVGFIFNFVLVMGLALFIVGIMEGGAWWCWVGAIGCGLALLYAAWLDSNI